jgi:hypothetical protein
MSTLSTGAACVVTVAALVPAALDPADGAFWAMATEERAQIDDASASVLNWVFILMFFVLEFESHSYLWSKHGGFCQHTTVLHIEVQGTIRQGCVN